MTAPKQKSAGEGLAEGRRHFPAPAFDARFWTKVRFTAGCWEWIATRSPEGYGRISHKSGDDRGPDYTHRLVFALYHGPIPEGLLVCHWCDNRACCRPDHMFLGTVADNSADMVRKGRSRRGQKHAKAKLTEQQVIEIRRRYAGGGVTQEQLAEEFKVSGPHVCGIISRRFWKHLPADVP